MHIFFKRLVDRKSKLLLLLGSLCLFTSPSYGEYFVSEYSTSVKDEYLLMTKVGILFPMTERWRLGLSLDFHDTLTSRSRWYADSTIDLEYRLPINSFLKPYVGLSVGQGSYFADDFGRRNFDILRVNAGLYMQLSESIKLFASIHRRFTSCTDEVRNGASNMGATEIGGGLNFGL